MLDENFDLKPIWDLLDEDLLKQLLISDQKNNRKYFTLQEAVLIQILRELMIK